MLAVLLNLGFAGGGVAVAPEAQPETFSGGYFPYVRRKTEEDKRIERIQLGILPPDPKPFVIPERQRYQHPQREELTPNEIRAIRAKVKNKVDLEIALHLHEIEKKRKKTLALVLMLYAV